MSYETRLKCAESFYDNSWSDSDEDDSDDDQWARKPLVSTLPRQSSSTDFCEEAYTWKDEERDNSLSMELKFKEDICMSSAMDCFCSFSPPAPIESYGHKGYLTDTFSSTIKDVDFAAQRSKRMGNAVLTKSFPIYETGLNRSLNLQRVLLPPLELSLVSHISPETRKRRSPEKPL